MLFGFFNKAGNGGEWLCNGIDIVPTSTLAVEQAVEKGFIMYDVFGKQEFKVKLPSGKGTLTLFDMTGRVALTANLNTVDNTIDTSSLSSAIYVAKVVSDKGLVTNRKVALRQ